MRTRIKLGITDDLAVRRWGRMAYRLKNNHGRMKENSMRKKLIDLPSMVSE